MMSSFNILRQKIFITKDVLKFSKRAFRIAIIIDQHIQKVKGQGNLFERKHF